MAAPSCVPLEAISTEAVGGKAAGLAKLVSHGYQVPRGFVIVGAAPANLPEDLEEHYHRIGAGKVAVRSSASGEDSHGASFAGQYETLLNVEGDQALRAAVEQCLRSVQSAAAAAYRDAQTKSGDCKMSVIVQQMVDARAAGVLFTANPINARRDQVVIDAVRGLGDTLVGGRAAPDHWVLSKDGSVVQREVQHEEPVLTEAELVVLVDGGARAERWYGQPLDMEWAIDQSGDLRWLQARPATGLPADPNELDTVPYPGDVYTWCNIGEMMPGAVTPLTYSVTGRGIDIGMQRAYRRMGAPVPLGEQVRYVGMFFGHLFLNLSKLAELSAAVAGSDKKQMCLALCGRDVEEVAEPEPASVFRRAINGLRYGAVLLSATKHRHGLDALLEKLELPTVGDARQLYQAIDERLPQVFEAYELHLLASASAGALSPIMLGLLAGGEDPTQAHHAKLAELLAGANDVESADIAEGVERVIERLADRPNVNEAFASAAPKTALAWLCSSDAGEAGAELERYLDRHGHRAVRELELRQKEWGADPIPLIASLQSGLQARLKHGTPQRPNARRTPSRSRTIVGALLPLAHAAIRCREHTKSALVAVTTRFKHAYRALGLQMAAIGVLPDQDAVFFLTHDELGALLGGRRELADLAVSRRAVLDYQMPLHFPQIFKGRPEPLARQRVQAEDGALVGKPVSRGVVSGRARVVETIEEASELEAGEILIAPITDVGWTPYFGLIAGLATDVGSTVSHGAVVAREYGLPAVVNLRVATSRFQTGDWVELDGDRGTLSLL